MTTDTQSNDNDTGESYDGLSPSEIESLTEKDDDAEALDELLGEEDGADGQDSEEAEEAEETDDDADPEASDANGEDEPVSNERQEPVHQGTSSSRSMIARYSWASGSTTATSSFPSTCAR